MSVHSAERGAAPVSAWLPARSAGWIPIVLALVAIGAQIIYPNFTGSERDAITITTVLLLSAASLSHAWISRGWRVALTVAAVFVGGGLLIEMLGVATGFPFGDYVYSDRIGPMVGDVPLIIPLAWSMLGYPALVVARLIHPGRLVGTLIGAAALAAWDLYLDPQMVAEGYWTWSSAGPFLIDTIPATNYLAWFATAWVMMMALWHVTPSWGRADRHSVVPVGLYVWTWIGSAVAHLFYFDLFQSGLYGAVGMGAIVAILARALLNQADPPDQRTRSNAPQDVP